MKSTSRIGSVVFATVAGIVLSAGAAKAGYVQVNLVSDLPGLGAEITDTNLKNPWGMSFRGGATPSPFWVSDQGANLATLYSVSGPTNVSKVNLNVPIPTTATGPQGPTGQVSS